LKTNARNGVSSVLLGFRSPSIRPSGEIIIVLQPLQTYIEIYIYCIHSCRSLSSLKPPFIYPPESNQNSLEHVPQSNMAPEKKLHLNFFDMACNGNHMGVGMWK
jgi:hypothetical protein